MIARIYIPFITVFASLAAGAQTMQKEESLRRFSHYTEIGALATAKTTPDNVTTAAFSFQTVNGYRLTPQIFTGIGVGADLFATTTIFPLFGSIRVDMVKKGDIVPYYFVDAGYGYNATNSPNRSYRGGFAFATGAGLKLNLINNKGFLVSFGYRYQQAAVIENHIRKNADYNRIALRAGFYF